MTETRHCQQCNDEFNPKSTELFCSDDCRYKFWKRGKKPTDIGSSIDDLKCAIGAARNQAKNIVYHVDRIEKDYSDWEDRISAIEAQIRIIEEEVGIEEKELGIGQKIQEIDFNALDDLMKFEDI